MPTGWKAWQLANAPPAEVVAAAERAQSKPIKYKPRPVQQGGLNLIQAHRVQAPLLQVHLNVVIEVHAGYIHATSNRQQRVCRRHDLQKDQYDNLTESQYGNNTTSHVDRYHHVHK
jgi:hypothetical protein